MESDITAADSNLTAIYLALLGLCILLIITILYLLYYVGAFDYVDVNTRKSPFKELEVAYKFVRGYINEDYKLLCTETHLLAPNLKYLSIKYDGEQIPSEERRYAVGIILNDEKHPVSEEEKKKMVAKGYQITTFPVVDYVVYTDFPYINFLSVYVALNKVAAEFQKYIIEKKLEAYPLIEINDNEKIIYFAPLSKQSDFYVFEALAESDEDVTSEKTMDEGVEISSRDIEELPDTYSSLDSLGGGTSRIEELPSNEEMLDSLEGNEKHGSNSSEASTESFEELHLDS